MAQPTSGQIVSKTKIPVFEDANGEPIQFELQKDGNYTAPECEVPLGFDEKGKKTGVVKYTYTLTADGNNYVVGVNKVKELTKAGEKAGVDIGSSENIPVPEDESSHDKEVKKQKEIEKNLKKSK